GPRGDREVHRLQAPLGDRRRERDRARREARAARRARRRRRPNGPRPGPRPGARAWSRVRAPRAPAPPCDAGGGATRGTRGPPGRCGQRQRLERRARQAAPSPTPPWPARPGDPPGRLGPGTRRPLGRGARAALGLRAPTATARGGIPVRALVVPIAIAVFALAPAAADETVLGRTMAVSDPLPGVNTTTRIVQVVANEARATDEVLVGDPLADGASLEVIVNGATYGARHPA